MVGLHQAHAAFDLAFRSGGARDTTCSKMELAGLTIASLNREAGVHYLPTPWRVLDWLHAMLPPPDARWSFVDLGCGKGRALMSAAARPYGRVIGVEFARELAQLAAANVATSISRRAGSIEIVEGDAADFKLPASPLCVYLFNPFGPPVIERVAENLARTYGDTPRPIFVAYLNPRHAELFDALPQFQRVPTGRAMGMKLALLSPYRLHLYATPEAMALLPEAQSDRTPPVTPAGAPLSR
ncbi:MAG: class I SAM-dependent methyltransferase [Hyphomicrobiaceae bacterium]